jgi:large conductance mechanosensitive channel
VRCDVKKLWQEFKTFINRGNVVDMAIGVAVASAFTAIVTAFTKGFVSPVIALLTGKSSLADLKYVVRAEVLAEDGSVLTPEVAILWGAFVQAVLDFLIIAAVFFAVIKIVATFRRHAEKMQQEMKNYFTDADERAALEKAEAEAKAEAERAAAEEAGERRSPT